MNIGTVETELKGADSYTAKEMVADKNAAAKTEAPIDNKLTL
jgi:hypothetical protein